MWIRIAAAVAWIAGSAVGQTQTQETMPAAEFQRLQTIIRPDPKKSFEAIPWMTSLWDARKKAAAEDKPIVICYTGGAGYNEPLGVC